MSVLAVFGYVLAIGAAWVLAPIFVVIFCFLLFYLVIWLLAIFTQKKGKNVLPKRRIY